MTTLKLHENKENDALGRVSVQTRQPKSGYLPIREFKQSKLTYTYDGDNLQIPNDVPSGEILRAVYMLVRYKMGVSPQKTFWQAIKGSTLVAKRPLAEAAIQEIRGLDATSIAAALKLAQYEILYCMNAKPGDEEILCEADYGLDTIKAIQDMVIRVLRFMIDYGPVIAHRSDFFCGYTRKIPSGTGEFLTNDMILELAMSDKPPRPSQTLKLLLSWRLGLYSVHNTYGRIKYLGIYNVKTDTLYQYDVSAIPDETIIAVDTKVIGYKE